jgi:hypothetical protein
MADARRSFCHRRDSSTVLLASPAETGPVIELTDRGAVKVLRLPVQVPRLDRGLFRTAPGRHCARDFPEAGRAVHSTVTMTASELRPRLPLIAAASTFVLLTACGQSANQPGAAKSTDRAAQSSPPASTEAQSQPAVAGSPGNQGGQTTPTGYTDTRYHYRLMGPGQINPRSDGTASFVGEDEKLEVAVVEGARAADPMALAQAEVSSLNSTMPGVHIASRPAQVSLGGHSMVKFSYTWTANTQASGKQVKMTGVRYFIPKDAGTVAVVRYGDSSSQFDTQEADGFASSFRWL